MSALRTTPHLRGRIRLAAASGGGGHRVSVFGRTDQRRSALKTCKSGLAQFAAFRLLQPGLVRPPLQLPFVPPSVMNRCPHLVWELRAFHVYSICKSFFLSSKASAHRLESRGIFAVQASKVAHQTAGLDDHVIFPVPEMRVASAPRGAV